MKAKSHWEKEIKAQRMKGWIIISFLLLIIIGLASFPTITKWQRKRQYAKYWTEIEAEEMAEKEAEKEKAQEPIDRIEKALDMEDWDMANSLIEKMIGNGEQDLTLFEKVWKKEARYIIKKNDWEGFCNLSDVMSMYNINPIPMVDRQFYKKAAEARYCANKEDSKIYMSGIEYQEEVIRFNAIVDDIVDMALMRGNKQIAEKCLILYWKDIELKESSKKESSFYCTDDNKAEWKYTEKSKDEAKKRIANTK